MDCLVEADALSADALVRSTPGSAAETSIALSVAKVGASCKFDDPAIFGVTELRYAIGDVLLRRSLSAADLASSAIPNAAAPSAEKP